MLILLRLGEKLLEVCKNHDLLCVAAYGTLKGAVLYDGFVPWSVDMDFYMPRNDYDKLINLYSDEFQYPYFLQSSQNEKSYFRAHIRLRNSLTTCIPPIDKNNSGCNNGLYIDIFPLDALPVCGKIRTRMFFLRRFVLYQMILEMVYGVEKKQMASASLKRKIKIVIKLFIIKILSLFGDYKHYDEKFNKLCAKYNDRKNTKYYSLNTFQFDYNQNLLKEECFETEMHKFEDIEIPIPKKYDAWLTKTYGDYKQIPSYETRVKRLQTSIVDALVSYKDYKIDSSENN